MATGPRWRAPACSCRCRIRRRPAPARPARSRPRFRRPRRCRRRASPRDRSGSACALAFGLAALDAAEPSPCSARSSAVERHHQRGDAARAGVPVGKPRIVVDQPAERGLHDGEGGGRLHHLAERHAAVEKFRRAQQDRHDRRNQARCPATPPSCACAGRQAAPIAAARSRTSCRCRRAPPPRRRAARCSRRFRARASACSGIRPRPGSCPRRPARSCGRSSPSSRWRSRRRARRR